MPFADRKQAGEVLAGLLIQYRDDPSVIVLALPRGGVPVAYEVARALHAPLDVFIVRKLGFPGHEEYAMGAIASGGARVLNDASLHVERKDIDAAVAREQRELERRELLYRDGRPAPRLAGRTVLLVDDGLATGASMRAAVMAVKQLSPARVVVAVPVAAPDTCAALRAEVDEVVCARTPEPFQAVGRWYDDFRQTSDEEVRELLESSRSADARH